MSLKRSLFARTIEAIPFPFSRLYAFITRPRVFKVFYQMVAAQILERTAYGRVLDIGCGPGKLDLIVAEKAPYVHVTGVDLSPDMVHIAADAARKKRLHNVEFRHGDSAELPFGEEEFDMAVSTLSFHHWKHPEAALDEIYRVLKHGGEAWIYDAPSKVDVRNLSEKYRKYGFFARMLFSLHSLVEPYYSEEDISRMAAGSRFKEHKIDHVELVFRLRLYK